LGTRCYKHCEETRRSTQANKPYGTEEVFEVIKVAAEDPVRLGNRTYQPGGATVIFFKLTLMVAGC